ncbi:MAG: hypothetical protein Q9P14_10325 [candidate division KSB1 bacterium]|nr:hypothetical protein [candidate division KSB1 bacterium]
MALDKPPCLGPAFSLSPEQNMLAPASLVRRRASLVTRQWIAVIEGILSKPAATLPARSLQHRFLPHGRHDLDHVHLFQAHMSGFMRVVHCHSSRLWNDPSPLDAAEKFFVDRNPLPD